MIDDFLEIFNYFDATNQRNKLCEEFRELQDELFCIHELGIDRNNLLDEGVDVISLVLQFLFANGIDQKDIIDKMQIKLKRTKHRKNDGYYGKGQCKK